CRFVHSSDCKNLYNAAQSVLYKMGPAPRPLGSWILGTSPPPHLGTVLHLWRGYARGNSHRSEPNHRAWSSRCSISARNRGRWRWHCPSSQSAGRDDCVAEAAVVRERVSYDFDLLGLLEQGFFDELSG